MLGNKILNSCFESKMNRLRSFYNTILRHKVLWLICGFLFTSFLIVMYGQMTSLMLREILKRLYLNTPSLLLNRYTCTYNEIFD